MIVIKYETGEQSMSVRYSDNQSIKGVFEVNADSMQDAIKRFNDVHPINACIKFNMRYVPDAE